MHLLGQLSLVRLGVMNRSKPRRTARLVKVALPPGRGKLRQFASGEDAQLQGLGATSCDSSAGLYHTLPVLAFGSVSSSASNTPTADGEVPVMAHRRFRLIHVIPSGLADLCLRGTKSISRPEPGH